MKATDILRPTPQGLYCEAGDFFIDPVRPVEAAVITHGHADHARAGHGVVAATPETLAIMAARYGAGFANRQEAAGYGHALTRNGVEIRLHPAGHILGSAQVAVTVGAARAVVSGDYKRTPDPTCPPFEPVACDVFITEATFALPVFVNPDPKGEIERLLASVRRFPERAHLVGVYALGKAQRLIRLLRQAGWDRPIYAHGSLDALNAVYARFGADLGPVAGVTNRPAAEFAGEIILAPPSAIADRWARRFPEPVTAFASGWMRVRARARQRGVELPLILSDHADWPELTGTLREVSPQEIWITHGREEALARWAALEGLTARALSLVGYDDEPEAN